KSNCDGTVTAKVRQEDDDRVQIHDPCSFERAIQQIEKTILSISPGVHFPPPHLLVRLRDEEAALAGVAFRPQSFATSDVSSPLELSGVFGGRLRRWRSVRRTISSRGEANPYAEYSTEHPPDLKPVSPRSGVSARNVGLGYVSTNNNSLLAVIQHQSLAYSYSLYQSRSSTIPCRSQELKICQYYEKRQGPTLDLTLGQQINEWSQQFYDACSDMNCSFHVGQHMHTYTHFNARVSVIMTEDDAIMPLDAQDQVYHWTECRSCSWQLVPIPVSTATWMYSFGKYLELLVYHPGLKPPTSCEHVQSDCRAIRQCFRQGRISMRIATEAINLYEMRTPKIQVVPAHLTPLTPQKGDNPLDPVEADDILSRLKSEVSCFYGSVRDVIRTLKSHTGASAVREGRGTPAQIRRQVTLDEMARDFVDDEQCLVDQSKRIVASSTNNVRRRFDVISAATVTRLDDWKTQHAPEVAVPNYVLPEYITTKGTYLFPNSYIVLRIEEPSSVIAFTLNSKEYLREITIGSAAGTFALGAAADGALWDVTQGNCRFKLKAFSHDTAPDAPRTHIKYKFSNGQQSFCCTAYYALQFEELRVRCGFDVRVFQNDG
ncbi:hypothetical protein SeMB42_g01728, partial [Synchytrium endobioticum]